MTERQYVEHIRKMAQAYMDSFKPGELDHAAMTRWQTVKQHLSPDTAVALCDAWLAQEPPNPQRVPD